MNSFVYMDIYRCGKIARVAVVSYLKFYPETNLYLYGVPADFRWLEDLTSKHKNIKLVDISDDTELLKKWNIHGHLGTAYLWAKLINERSEKFLIHLDSDVIFRGRALDQIFEKIEEGYSIVGSPRNYKNNLNGIDSVRHLDDLVQTAIFAFDKELVSEHEFDELVLMCRGSFNPLGHPVIDFFDPVMFEIIKNGGKVFHLDIEDYGGTHLDGHRKNSYGELNEFFDIGNLFCHFASVGSGMKYFYDKSTQVFTPKSYVVHGLERYWLFSYVFYNQDLKMSFDKMRMRSLSKKFYNVIVEGVDLDVVRNAINLEDLDTLNELTFMENIHGMSLVFSELTKKVNGRIKRLFSNA